MIHSFRPAGASRERARPARAKNTSPQLFPGRSGIFFVLALSSVLLAGSCSTLDGFRTTAQKTAEFLSPPWHWTNTLKSLFDQTSAGPKTTTYEPDYIHWFDEFVFIKANRAKINALKNRYGSRFPDIALAEQGNPAVYRVRKRDAAFFQDRGFAILNSGPYLWIDPGLKTRKRSRRLQDWMKGYKDEELIETILRTLSRKHSNLARLIRVGNSVQDRPIYALRISRDFSRQKPSLLFNSGHHGMEVLSVEYSLDLACMLLDEDCYPNSVAMPAALREYILNETVVWIVPMVNPDGLHKFWYTSGYLGRKNANGVDLNRNYPFYWKSGNEMASSGSSSSYKYRGPEPASEPETKAMMQLAKEQRFLFSVSFHTYATRVLFPYTPDGAANPYPDPAVFLARRMAAPGTSYRTTRQYEAARKLYSVDGTDQDWLYHEFGTMAFIVEGSMSTPSYEDALKSVAGMRPVILEGLRAIKEGPRLRLRVEDARGGPLGNARITVLSRTSYEGEKWPVTDEFGEADLFLAPEEEVIGEIQAPGFETVRFRLECSSVCVRRFQLTPIPR